MNAPSRPVTRARITSMIRWLEALRMGMSGVPQALGAGQADAMERTLEQMSIRLLSKTVAMREGLVLKRGAKPVVIRWYCAPISRRHGLYLAEQFKRVSAPDPLENA